MQQKQYAVLLAAAFLFCAAMVFVGLFGEAGEEIPSYAFSFPTGAQEETSSENIGAVTEEVQAAETKQASLTPVDINAATLQELESLPGVGEVTAQSIVTYREEHGPFAGVEELDKVKGIGTAKLEKLKPYICVSP